MGSCLRSAASLTFAALLSLAATILVAAAEEELTDEAKERFLRTARVVRIQEMLPGSTGPMALDLGGGFGKAVFKYRPADPDSPEAIDSYRHEVAAYRLDRSLGLEMVPVAVIRYIHSEGAVIEWISDASTEEELQEAGEFARISRRVSEQRALMVVFDALISNGDRKTSDQLITPEDGKLHLVDHSRAFQTTSELPAEFLSSPVRLSRSLLERLGGLDAGSLGERLGELLTDAQLVTLLERRDKIVAKVESDRRERGDSSVFLD